MKRLSRSEALKLSHRIVKKGNVLLSRHCREQMVARNFDMQDVLHVIRTGKILSEGEPHPRTGRWNYRIEGSTVDGKRLAVIADLYEEENRLIVMTGIN